MVRRNSALLGSACLLTLLFVGTRANAGPVRFRYVGGSWSHNRHSGWHRYWGGPSIGFYFAPAPVYIVSGYPAPSYYTGSSFWYSNPSFGLNVNIGGTGYSGRYGGRASGNGHGGYGSHVGYGGRTSGGGHAGGGDRK